MDQTTIKTIVAALLGAAAGYYLAKRRAASTEATAHNDTAGQAEQWWSYAGSWSV